MNPLKKNRLHRTPIKYGNAQSWLEYLTPFRGKTASSGGIRAARESDAE